jgi:hypothetical protein
MVIALLQDTNFYVPGEEGHDLWWPDAGIFQMRVGDELEVQPNGFRATFSPSIELTLYPTEDKKGRYVARATATRSRPPSP